MMTVLHDLLPTCLRGALLASVVAGPAVACDTALLLAVDVSNSIDPGEYRIQTEGIAAALRDPTVAEAMVQGGNAVAIVQWSGLGMQRLAVPWTRVTSHGALEALAQRAEAMPRAFSGGNTAVGEAIQVSLATMREAGDCSRRIIDVSGDGADNAGSAVRIARRNAEQQGVTINGLAIEGLGPAITSYYRRVVITSDGFVETAQGFRDFARAIRAKMRREVSRVTG